MPTYNSSKMSDVAKQIISGVNAVKATYDSSATASGSITLNMIPLPKGAEVIGVALKTSGAGDGDVTDTYAVKDNEGNQYLATATPSAVDSGVQQFFGADTFSRITGSAQLYVEISKGSTGTSSLHVELTALYNAELDGD